MHMGALPVIGSLSPKNFIHVVFDNEAHDSVGGQATLLDKTDLTSVALASGYVHAAVARDEQQIISELGSMLGILGPKMLQIKVRKGYRSNLGRPKKSPIEAKRIFMNRFN
jgi:phosphonopyruvate decarboxylase